ncbi:MAG: hypothetical protein ABIM40_12805, partial [Pseudomonadota bacterium]
PRGAVSPSPRYRAGPFRIPTRVSRARQGPSASGGWEQGRKTFPGAGSPFRDRFSLRRSE